MNLKEQLKRSIVFRNLNYHEIDKLIPFSRVEKHPAGAVLYREGDFAGSLYIVIRGETALDLLNKMEPYGPPKAMTVDIIYPGDAMGWSALVAPHIYTLGCKCVTDCSLISVSGPELIKLMENEPNIGLMIMTAMAKIIATRLTNTRELMIGERGLQLAANF